MKEPMGRARARASTRRWTIVSDSWLPKHQHRQLARELGLDLGREEAAFRDHEFKTPKTDADRAFNAWLRRAQDFGGTRGGNGVPRSGRPSSLEAFLEQQEQEQQEQGDLTSADGAKSLPVLAQEAWSRAAHGGLPAGSLSRVVVHECCDVLTARGLGVDAFEAAARTWVEGKRLRGERPRFEFFARDLAGLLDDRAPVRRRGAPAPVSSAADFAAAGEDDFEAILAAAARQGAQA